MQYEEFERSSQVAAHGFKWITFDLTVHDHSLNLSNTINRFLLDVRYLEAWGVVLDESDEQTRLDILWNIVQTLVHAVLSTPYVVRSRMLFCTVMMVHEAAQVSDLGIPNYIDERRIALGTLDNPLYRDFLEILGVDFGPMRSAILAVNSGDISEYRNRFQHRLPRDVEFGWSPTIVRAQKDGKVAYGIGGTEPFRVSEMLPLLYDEHFRALAAYDHYVKLVHDLIQSLDSLQAGPGT